MLNVDDAMVIFAMDDCGACSGDVCPLVGIGD